MQLISPNLYEDVLSRQAGIAAGVWAGGGGLPWLTDSPPLKRLSPKTLDILIMKVFVYVSG